MEFLCAIVSTNLIKNFSSRRQRYQEIKRLTATSIFGREGRLISKELKQHIISFFFFFDWIKNIFSLKIQDFDDFRIWFF